MELLIFRATGEREIMRRAARRLQQMLASVELKIRCTRSLFILNDLLSCLLYSGFIEKHRYNRSR